jgi:hypothetical protein
MTHGNALMLVVTVFGYKEDVKALLLLQTTH